MKPPHTFRCALIGEGTLPIQCAELLLSSGHHIDVIASRDDAVLHWGRAHAIDAVDVDDIAELGRLLRDRSFDYLFSIVNPTILPGDILCLPRRLAINYHDAPLPRYAGVHATSWALMKGERCHGITWHVMSVGVDAGDILRQSLLDVAPDETAFSLNVKCYEAAIRSFAELMDDLAFDRVRPRAQDRSLRTYFARDRRPAAAAVVRWSDPGEDLDALVRALDFGPYRNPLALPKIKIGEDCLVIGDVRVSADATPMPPGTLLRVTLQGLEITTGTRDVRVGKISTIEGTPLEVGDVVNRYGLNPGFRFDDVSGPWADRVTAVNTLAARNEDFWRARLATVEPLELPFVDRSTSGEAGDVVVIPIALPAELGLPKRAGAAVAARLVAAHLGFLARLAGMSSFDIGFRDPELHHVAAGLEALFASYVPLHVDLGPRDSVMVLEAAITTQIESIRPRAVYARDVVARYPEIQSRAALTRPAPWPITIALDASHAATGRPHGDLHVRIAPDGTECAWSYRARVFEAGVAERLAQQFTYFLRGVAGKPERPLAEVPLVSPEERHTLLVAWNSMATEYPKDRYVPQLVEDQADARPDAVAVVARDRQLTYGELDRRATQLARFLRRFGVGPEVIVAVCLRPGADAIVALLAVLKSGAAYAPLDPSYPRERLAFMTDDTRTPVLLTQKDLVDLVPAQAAKTICIDSDWTRIARESTSRLPCRVAAANIAYVVYTSGSTGKPKGVLIPHEALLNLVYWDRRAFDISADDRASQIAGVAFDATVWEIWPCLTAGAGLYVADEEIRSAPARLRDWLAAHAITLSFMPTPVAEAFTALDVPPGLALRTLLIGGDQLHYPTRRLPFRIVNNYGPAEYTVVTTSGTVAPEQRAGTLPPIGRPLPNTCLYVLDDHLEPVPIGWPGELYISGVGLARGYLNRPDLTAERFLANPFSQYPDDRMYRTGDLVRYRPDSTLEFLRRLDDQVKLRGVRIELGEIEAVLRQHPSVGETIVVLREDRSGEKRLVAYVVPRATASVRVTELRSSLRKTLPMSMIPSAIVQLPAMPLTPNGKIDRRALPDPDRYGLQAETPYVAPRTALERSLTELLADVLQLERVGVEDNFFDLGGHSLLATQFVAQVRHQFDVELPLRAFFENPTIAGVSTHMTMLLGPRPGVTLPH